MIHPDVQKEHMGQQDGRYSKRMVPQMELIDDESSMGYEEFDQSEPPTRPANMPRPPEQGMDRTMGGDEEIMPGLFRSDIDSWKAQYEDVYHAEVKGRDFIYRMLTRFEYKQIMAVPNTDPMMREEMICEYCVLYPVDYDFSTMAGGAAGVPSILSESIMDTAGFTRDIRITKL